MKSLYASNKKLLLYINQDGKQHSNVDIKIIFISRFLQEERMFLLFSVA